MQTTESPRLETTRLWLRELRHQDANAVHSIRGDAKAVALMGSGVTKDLEDAHGFISRSLSERQAPVPATRWVLERKTDQLMLGTCAVFGWSLPWQKCLIGYELAPDVRGQGYMYEATSAMLAWAFKYMLLHRVEALVHPKNLPSLKLAERLGFVVEGRLREVAYWDENRHDMLQLSLLKHE